MSRKMETPTAVVAMLGIESLARSSGSFWTLGPSEDEEAGVRAATKATNAELSQKL